LAGLPSTGKAAFSADRQRVHAAERRRIDRD
jgi:hypothetical protein